MAKAKLLVLEDRIGRGSLLQQRLTRLGYKVVSSTAAEAIRKTAESHPALVLIDMKPTSGTDRAALAGVLKARFGTPVIILVSPADKKKLIRIGHISPLECIAKPFTDHELQATIETILKSHRNKVSPLVDESWCHSVVCSIRDAVIVTEKTGMTVFLNPAAEKLTGWTLDDATGRPLYEIFKAVGEDTGRPISLPFGKMSRRRPAVTPDLMMLSTRGGSAKHIESSIAALSGAGGKIVGVVLVFRDVTERFLMARSALARQKIEAIGTLANGIAHDFGILIGTIDAHASSLAESLIPRTKAHDATAKIMDATKEARELTSHLAALAQASEPRLQHTTNPVSLAQVIADGAKVLEKTFADHHITFVTADPGKMPFVKADAAQLLDSLICVFLNSVDAMPKEGTLTVRVSVKKFSRPKRRLNPEAGTGLYAILSITDTGQGMSRQTLSHIFEPFFTTKQPGLIKGLGMTIAHATILAWGGWITVQSALNKGTTVNIHIPVADVATPSAADTTAGGETILVVDDSESDLALFRTILEEHGYKVHTANNGAQGASMHHGLSDNIDLVVVDLIMPQSDGRELFRKIIDRDPDAAVIITSGFSRDFVRSRLGQGGWGFIQKPIEKDQLLHAVSRALEQRMVQDDDSGTGMSEGDVATLQKS